MRASTLYAPTTGEGRGNAEGLRLFEGSCVSCHGWNGEGVQTHEGHLGMPAFRHAFTDAEVAAIANYVLQHFGDKRPTVTPERVAKARVTSK